mmetsp:Transcript_27106/g.45487  ORF Transcript_27106/g.45487 Transcript_27106/m.45487 type:complete len:389 (-) Transcript_27106:59-1225(-)
MSTAQAASARGSYTFASEPRAVQNRKKYREAVKPDPNSLNGANIMFDKRIVRGNTYATQQLPAAAAQDSQRALKKPDSAGRRKTKSQRLTAAEQLAVPPVEGRKHIDVQTEQYLEELSDRVTESVAETQTDIFMDRPPTPLFIPKKTGVDAEAQIEDGDLFNYDVEVEPLLEVLIGKTLEQSMMEVMEEEELAAIRAHQEEYDQIRNAELAEVQRMEAAERRRFEEKERRLAQERARVAKEKAVREKVAATMYSKTYVQGLVHNVFSGLAQAGYFYDPVVKEVEEDFVPWLMDRSIVHLEQRRTSRALIDDLLQQALQLGLQKRLDDRERIRKEDERRRRQEEEAKEQERIRVEEEVRRVEEERIRKETAEAEEGEPGEEAEEEEEES